MKRILESRREEMIEIINGKRENWNHEERIGIMKR